MSRGDEIPYDDRAQERYRGLDDDERAEAIAQEAALRRNPIRSDVPRQPGMVLTRRSLWSAVAVVVTAFSTFGAVVHRIDGIAIAGLALAAAMVAYGRGAARRVEVGEPGQLSIRGGLWGATVELTDFDWVAAYRSSVQWRARPASMVLLHRRRHPTVLARAVGVLCPNVSRRRATVILSSMWRLPAERQRVADNAMAEFFRAACRDSGMDVTRGQGSVIWTAERTRRPL